MLPRDQLRCHRRAYLLENEFGAVDCTVSLTVRMTVLMTVRRTVAGTVMVTILMLVMASILTARRLVGGARSALCRAAHAP